MKFKEYLNEDRLNEYKFHDSLGLPRGEIRFGKFIYDENGEMVDDEYAFNGIIKRDINSSYIVVTSSRDKSVRVGDEFHDVEFTNYSIVIYINRIADDKPKYGYLNF